ncbi:MAG: BREX system P-loop protein BrxC, partial [Gammaproteobacteria bacterium]
DTASGRLLTDEFAKDPFGWDFEAVRLLVLCLLRAGKIEATSRGQTIDLATSIDAKDTFSNNNLFRQSSFRPKKGIEFEELVKASAVFRDTFGSEVREINAGAIAEELRREAAHYEDTVATALAQLTANRLPGGNVLEGALGQMKAILRGTVDNTIATFNASHRSIKEAIQRGAELEQALTEPRLRDLERARQALDTAWPSLQQEPDLPEELRTKAEALEDLLARETFFRELPTIEQHTRAVETEYDRRYEEALQARIEAYARAFDQLVKTPGWSDIDEDQQRRISGRLQALATRDQGKTIPELCAEREACESRLKAAVAEVHRILEGERLVAVNLGSYFAGGIETEEQLDAALDGIREEFARLIG